MNLTPRETDLAQLVARGFSRTTLSQTMEVSLSAVDKLLRSLRKKMHASNHSQLVLACGAYVDDLSKHDANGGSAGALNIHPSTDEGTTHAPKGSFKAGNFDELFTELQQALEPLGVTDVVYSHIESKDTDSVEHIATRWTFPPEIPFDFSIPADENLAFKYAIANWAPMPMDLEAMAASELYDYMPQAIRAQNDVFIKAGMSRGVTFVLPGLDASDRLVASLLLRHASAAELSSFVERRLPEAHYILSQFRNAHIGLASKHKLPPRKQLELANALVAEQTLTQAAETCGYSRRAADRHLAELRAFFGTDTNAATIAAYVKLQGQRTLPF